MDLYSEEFGRLSVETLPCGEDRGLDTSTYTYSGRVLCAFITDAGKELWHLETMNDDGSDIKTVFDGVIHQKPRANGCRFMCFPDNRRVLLGDYILEASPDLDHPESVELLDLIYPSEITEAPGIFCRWSEIIVSPDNVHMGWTLLTFTGAQVYLGKLVRDEAAYHLEEVCEISAGGTYAPDPENPGFFLLEGPMRGGEIKQFVRGGLAISEVGHSDSNTDSVIQYLNSEAVEKITHKPGYEETTIFSPDEKLGLVMSTRFSPRSNAAVFGLIPLPHSMPVRAKMLNSVYWYAIGAVRTFRKGNIGPALIDIQKEQSGDPAYYGVDLHDPDDLWVYCSPMSFHPDSNRAMWMEIERATGKRRARLVRLSDRPAAAPVPAAVTPSPEEIPYARKTAAGNRTAPAAEMKIAGKEGLVWIRDADHVSYEHYSEDGLTFLDGSVTITAPASMIGAGKTVFEGKLSVTGAHTGGMDMKVVLEKKDMQAPLMLLKDESCGSVTYDGITIDIADYEP